MSPPLLYEFLAVASENGQCCLPPLLLLLRAIDFRRERGDYEAATAFRLAANHVFPPPGQGTPSGPTGGGGGSGALWRRSLPRWIRGVMEHEAVVVDLLRSMNCNGLSSTPSQVRIEETELVNRCKAILANDLGPDAVISDDLVSCATCYLLIKVSSPRPLNTISWRSHSESAIAIILRGIEVIYETEMMQLHCSNRHSWQFYFDFNPPCMCRRRDRRTVATNDSMVMPLQ